MTKEDQQPAKCARTAEVTPVNISSHFLPSIDCGSTLLRLQPSPVCSPYFTVHTSGCNLQDSDVRPGHATPGVYMHLYYLFMLLLVGRLLSSAILAEPRLVVKSVAEQALTLFFSFTSAVYPACVHSVITTTGMRRL